MPQQTNLTIKKNDGTTDIVWTGVVPSAGDKAPARWESLTVGSSMAHRPYMTHSSRDNGPGTARRAEVNVVYPVVDADGNVVDKLIFSGSWVLAKRAPTTDVNEFATQTANLLDHADIVGLIKSGFSAT